MTGPAGRARYGSFAGARTTGTATLMRFRCTAFGASPILIRYQYGGRCLVTEGGEKVTQPRRDQQPKPVVDDGTRSCALARENAPVGR